MKYLIGAIFSIAMGIYSLYQHKGKGEILVAGVCFIASILFLGQFIAGL